MFYKNITITSIWKYIHQDNKVITYKEYTKFNDYGNDQILIEKFLSKLSKKCNISLDYLKFDTIIRILLINRYSDYNLLKEIDNDKIYFLRKKSREIYEFIVYNNNNYRLLGKKIFTIHLLITEVISNIYFNELCELYNIYLNRINKYRKIPEKEFFVKKMDTFLNKIKIQLNSINPNYKNIIENNKINFKDNIYIILKKQYWKNLHKEIVKKNYKIIDSIIDNYQEFLIQFDIPETFIENLDKFKGIYTRENIIKVISCIIKYNQNIDHFKYEKHYVKLLENIKSTNNLIDFLKICFDRIELINNYY